LKIQTDGKIIVGGEFTSYSGSAQNRIIRINTDGSRDTSFNIGTGFDSSVYTTELQSDGKILVGGVFTSYSGSAQNRLTRINTDGTRDTEFNIGTGFNAAVTFIYLQNDGKILVGGTFTTYQSQTHNHLVRLNSDGSIDSTFNIGAGLFGAYRLNCQTVYTNSSNSLVSLVEYTITSPISYSWVKYETAMIPLQGMQFFAITKDSSALYSQYWNGVLRNTESLPTALGTGIDLNRIGTAYGRIGSVTLYNRALSASEILQNYNATKNRFGIQ
jgi:uncharacterized delta-60 repeat protein